MATRPWLAREGRLSFSFRSWSPPVSPSSLPYPLRSQFTAGNGSEMLGETRAGGPSRIPDGQQSADAMCLLPSPGHAMAASPPAAVVVLDPITQRFGLVR